MLEWQKDYIVRYVLWLMQSIKEMAINLREANKLDMSDLKNKALFDSMALSLATQMQNLIFMKPLLKSADLKNYDELMQSLLELQASGEKLVSTLDGFTKFEEVL